MGPIEAVFGLLLCLYSIAQLGVAAYALLFDPIKGAFDWIFVSALMLSGAGGSVGGWRLSDRRPGGKWLLLPAMVHFPLFLYLALVWLLDGAFWST